METSEPLSTYPDRLRNKKRTPIGDENLAGLIIIASPNSRNKKKTPIGDIN